MNATTNRYDELSPREQLDIDELINTIAAHRGIDHAASQDECPTCHA